MKKHNVLPKFFILIFTFAIITLNIHARDNAYTVALSPTIDRFVQPIECTSDGIQSFITEVFNHPEYTTDFLPYNFSHAIQLLDLAKEKKSKLFTRSVLKLFTQKINGCFHVNGYEFQHMLHKLPQLLEEQCKQTEQQASAFEQLKQSIKQLFYSAFMEQFSWFQEKPHDFLDDLAQKTLHLTEQNSPQKNQELLNNTITRFIESGLHKLIWSPHDHANVWYSFKAIAQDLEALHTAGIISDTDNLDDLYWSLIHRFCYFLNAMGSRLNPSFFETAKKDLREPSLLIFTLEEQEELMETKMQHLIRTLRGAEAAARAAHLPMR